MRVWLEGVQNDMNALELCLAVSYKLNIQSPYDPAVPLLGVYLKDGKGPFKNLHMDILNSFAHNHQKLEVI